MNRRVFLQTTAAAALSAQPSGAIYLADLDHCTPATALSRKPRRGHWRLLDFEAEGVKGAMLVAGQNTGAPEIRYRLPQRGRYEIWFGLRSYGGEDQTHVLAKLSRDSAFSLVVHHGEDRARLDEYYWKTADVSGQDLILRQFRRQLVPGDPNSVANPCAGVWLGYIKLVPASGDVTAKEHKRLYAHHDAWSYTYQYRPTSADDIRRELEPFRETDFARIYWEGGMGDRMYLPTKKGVPATDHWIEDPYRVGDRLAAESWQALKQKGIDPFRTALDHAHSMGMEFHATYRPAGFHFPVPEDEWNTGGVYDKHPEWRGRDKQGRPTPRLSYAYPEVRKTALGFVQEMLTYPVDGVCIAYNRRPPLVEYEAPIVDSFRAQTGLDARQLDDRDPRWLKARAGVLTAFMRELRAVVGRKPVTAIVMSSERENLFHAIDLEAWIAEGLVDTIVPYTSVERLTSTADSWDNAHDLDFFVRITRGTKCELAPNMMPRVMPPETYLRRARAIYDLGVERLFFWDTNARYDFGPSWRTLRRLGHKDEVKERQVERPGKKLFKLGDWDLTYATPG
ncbi:MAG: family 10 glycosylhydrolase [Bryobacteraceae bacterium]